jgi:hypothetical protein
MLGSLTTPLTMICTLEADEDSWRRRWGLRVGCLKREILDHPYFFFLIIIDPLFIHFFYFARYRTIVVLQIYYVES